MANDSKLLHRAIAKLDGMIHGKIDNRPKNVEKLKNVLSKETKVIYVNQMMNNLLTLDNEIPLKSNESIFMTDTELDAEIIERTFENAKQSGRQVFLIPCDSDMHRDIKTKLKEWYKHRPEAIDPADPVRDIACICTIDTTIDGEKVFRALEKLHIIHPWLDLVSYKLPETEAFEALQEAWNSWQEKIRNNLSEVSARTYEIFAGLIKEANDKIQNTKIKELEEYCEEMYVSVYPKYRKVNSNRTYKMEISEDKHIEDVQDGLQEKDRKSEMLNTPMYLWSVSMEPVVVFVLLRLNELEKKPESRHDLINFIRSIGNITYLISPRQLLSELPAAEMAMFGEEVTFNIRLGCTASSKSFSLRDTHKLASILTFPVKNKKAHVQSFRSFRGFYDRMDTSTDQTKATLHSFQEYILKQVKQLSQRTGSVLLYGDEEANSRCRANVQNYFTSLSEKSAVTEEDFTRQIIMRSYEHTTIPAEKLLNMLKEAKYLSVNEPDQSILYTQGFRKPKPVDSNDAERKYLTEWERFYRPRSKPTEQENLGFSALSIRKRKSDVPSLFQYKRPRITIDI